MKRFNRIIYSLLLLLLNYCNGYNILVVAPFPASSHSVIIQSISLELANRGHNVTIIATNLVIDAPENYHQIHVDDYKVIANLNISELFENSVHHTTFDQIKLMYDTTIPGLESTLNCKNVKDFIKNDKTNFDLVISEAFYQETLYMFAYKYKAPLVLLGTTSLVFHMADYMGISPPLSYAIHDFYRYDNGDTFIGKLINAMVITYDNISRKYYYLPKINKLAKEHFSSLERTLPNIEDLERNVSLILLNTHFSFDQVIPTVPGIVDIGGVHIKSVKKLPEDIQNFLDNAENGVIYFGLGSILKSCMMRKEIINAFIEVFQEMNQSVLWKWEDDNPPELNNSFVKKWLPQFDILSHPNVKLFINHGGMLGTQEAVYHGVPLVGIPIFTDQYSNVIKLVKHKAAIRLIYSQINKDTIRDAINNVLYDPDYKTNMKKLSERFKDRINKPIDTAMYWIEYVIRHKGLLDLKSPIAFMGLWEYYVIEIFLLSFISMVIILIFALSKISLKLNENNKIKKS